MQQAEFLKNVRETFTSAQAKASQRFESFEGDARKVLNELVEKGRVSQKDLAERLQRIAQSPIVQEKVKPVAEEMIGRVANPEVRAKVEELGKKAKDAQSKAFAYVDTTSRERATQIAGELRRLADALDTLAKKPTNGAEGLETPADTQVH